VADSDVSAQAKSGVLYKDDVMKKLFMVFLLGLVFFGSVEAQGNTYTTSFSSDESPISETGRWVNGQAIGIDWSNIRTATIGLAYGTQSGVGYPPNDSTAILTGTWGPNQMAQATVHTTNQQTGSVYEEVALRLRTTITAHSITGYECGFRVNHDGSQYLGVTRWNGAFNDYSSFANGGGPGLFNGDVVKATIIGNIITLYINGTSVYSIDITSMGGTVFTTGSPGIGFYLGGAAGLAGDYGFTSFAASDSSPPAAPTNLRVL
jgi:hypothetical protein